MASCLRFMLAVLTGIWIASSGEARADAPDIKGAGCVQAAPGPDQTAPVNFARDVRTVLSDNCFACHGPDDKTRKAGLRLDTKEGIAGEAEVGSRRGHTGQAR